MRRLLIAWLLSWVPALPAHAALQVFACEPEWGALVRELAGDKAEVFTATTALQDVHRIQARPSLMAAVRRADLVVCTGADLEVGWLPVLLRETGNAKVQPGRAGYFEAARFVTMLEVPASLDRSMGDVHPAGNPHIQTDPRTIARVAEALGARLAEVDPPNAGVYRSRHAEFARRWQEATARWEARAAPLRGTRAVVQHDAWPYLFAWLGLVKAGALEPKPGLEPTRSQMEALVASQAANPARMVIRAAYNSPAPAEWFAERARIPVVVLPFTVGGSDRATDLFGLFDDTVDRLLAARG